MNLSGCRPHRCPVQARPKGVSLFGLWLRGETGWGWFIVGTLGRHTPVRLVFPYESFLISRVCQLVRTLTIMSVARLYCVCDKTPMIGYVKYV